MNKQVAQVGDTIRITVPGSLFGIEFVVIECPDDQKNKNSTRWAWIKCDNGANLPWDVGAYVICGRCGTCKWWRTPHQGPENEIRRLQDEIRSCTRLPPVLFNPTDYPEDYSDRFQGVWPEMSANHIPCGEYAEYAKTRAAISHHGPKVTKR